MWRYGDTYIPFDGIRLVLDMQFHRGVHRHHQRKYPCWHFCPITHLTFKDLLAMACIMCLRGQGTQTLLTKQQTKPYKTIYITVKLMNYRKTWNRITIACKSFNVIEEEARVPKNDGLIHKICCSQIWNTWRHMKAQYLKISPTWFLRPAIVYAKFRRTSFIRRRGFRRDDSSTAQSQFNLSATGRFYTSGPCCTKGE